MTSKSGRIHKTATELFAKETKEEAPSSSEPYVGTLILAEAASIVYGRAEADYGDPLADFTRTAKMWEPIFGTTVTPKQVAMCMICVKLSREVNSHNKDNFVDIAGYAETAMRVVTGK